MVKAEELQERANATCHKLGLAACDVMIYIKMDDCVGIIGEDTGGCMVVYELWNPERYCVAVAKEALKNRKFIYDTLETMLGKYKKFLEQRGMSMDD